MPDLAYAFDIKRKPREVRAYWTDLPDDYKATSKSEQPFRIVVLRRTPSQLDLMTYWRLAGRVVKQPETLHLHGDGDWSFDVPLPLGIDQRDDFHMEATPDGTRLHISVSFAPRDWRGRVALPAWQAYASKWYGRTWASAARRCERDAPKA